MNSGSFVILMVFATLAFFGFAVYFIFKMLQFVIQATNLYKKMVERQDMMIKLLNDIKDKSSSSRLIEAGNESKIPTENIKSKQKIEEDKKEQAIKSGEIYENADGTFSIYDRTFSKRADADALKDLYKRTNRA